MLRIDSADRIQYAQNGVILLKQVLTDEILAECRRCFEWSLLHPSMGASTHYQGTPHAHYNDTTHPKAPQIYKPLLEKMQLGSFFSDLWNSRHVWFLAEEIIIKAGGTVGRTPWHQDSAYVPLRGSHFATLWISFESLSAFHSLEFVCGSHLGTYYDGANFNDPQNQTDPLWDHPSLPRLPDIEKERINKPDAWNIVSWPYAPGDLLLFHPSVLHGGAPVDDQYPQRHTLILRFFGDDLIYLPLPTANKNYFYPYRHSRRSIPEGGVPYRPTHLLQLR